ncbi:MAG: hypothetical protein AAFU03_16325 [Bacteroidota bacterium]
MVRGEMVVVSPWQEMLDEAGDLVDDVMTVVTQTNTILGQISSILGQLEGGAETLSTLMEQLEIVTGQIPYFPPGVDTTLQNAINCLRGAGLDGSEACEEEVQAAINAYQAALAKLYGANFQVPFYRSDSTAYGYDTLMYTEMDINQWYPEARIIDGKPYKTAWKSVPQGGADQALAQSIPTGKLDSVQFIKLDSTVIVGLEIAEDGARVTTNFTESPMIFAVHDAVDSLGSTTKKIAGQVAVVEYGFKLLNIVFVPVNNPLSYLYPLDLDQALLPKCAVDGKLHALIHVL